LEPHHEVVAVAHDDDAIETLLAVWNDCSGESGFGSIGHIVRTASLQGAKVHKSAVTCGNGMTAAAHAEPPVRSADRVSVGSPPPGGKREVVVMRTGKASASA
jgi:hypothetical protein